MRHPFLDGPVGQLLLQGPQLSSEVTPGTLCETEVRIDWRLVPLNVVVSVQVFSHSKGLFHAQRHLVEVRQVRRQLGLQLRIVLKARLDP